MNIEINLNFQIKNLSDEDIKGDEGNAGKLLGNRLASSVNTDALKYYDWGRLLYQGKSIKIDRADYDKIKDLVQNNPDLFAFTRAQIITSMEEQRTNQEKLPLI